MAPLRPARPRAHAAAPHPSRPHRSRSSAQTKGLESSRADIPPSRRLLGRISTLNCSFLHVQAGPSCNFWHSTIRCRLQQKRMRTQLHNHVPSIKPEEGQIQTSTAALQFACCAWPCLRGSRANGYGRCCRQRQKQQHARQAHHEQLPMLRITACEHTLHSQSPGKPEHSYVLHKGRCFASDPAQENHTTVT